MKKLIAFFEIPATDFRRAVDFYETVLGVQLPTFECETEKMAHFPEDVHEKYKSRKKVRNKKLRSVQPIISSPCPLLPVDIHIVRQIGRAHV